MTRPSSVPATGSSYLPLLPTEDTIDVPRLLDLTGDGQPSGDEADGAAVAAITTIAHARALWRAWRFAPRVPPQRILIAEVAGGDPMAAAQQLRLAVPDRTALIEVYGPGSALPDSQRAARGASALLWTAEPVALLRTARVFDRVDAERGPLFAADHPVVDAGDRPSLLSYLESGVVALATTQRIPDIMDPAAGLVVPMSYRTDGVWIWTDTVTYYLRTHGLRPDPELVAHIRTRPHGPSAVSAAALHRALAALLAPRH